MISIKRFINALLSYDMANRALHSEEIICPYCSHVYGERTDLVKFDDDNEAEVLCRGCGQLYLTTKEERTFYSSYPVRLRKD